MGCKQSRQVQVQPVGSLELRKDNSKLKKTNGVNERKNAKRTKSKKSMGSCASLDDGRSLESDRGGSAGSKGSKHSNDSGLGDDNGHIITEYSDLEKVKTVESEFKERDDLELGVTGTALPTRHSAKDKARLEESMILQKLREEGLISRPTNQSSGGVSFEVVEEGVQHANAVRPYPFKLASLEKRRKKKKALTEEEIREKLERAERRRKKKEEARLKKIREMEHVDQTAALESFSIYQKKKEEESIQKMESVADNREKRLREIKEKMKERERRAEEVRRRKSLNAERELQNQEQNEEHEHAHDNPVMAHKGHLDE